MFGIRGYETATNEFSGAFALRIPSLAEQRYFRLLGIGILCSEAKRDKRRKLGFKIRPGEEISIYGHIISESREVTEKLVKCDLDSIEVRISFFEDGRYPDGTERYTCGIAIAITQGNRTGMSMSHVSCWPHDRSRENRRASAAAYRLSLMEGLKLLLK